jgi:Domain of unknown function (DUF4893)
MMRRAVAMLIVTALGSACAGNRAIGMTPDTDWRRIATPDDARRLRGWRDAFVDGLRQAAASDAQAIAREGALLDPDAALDDVRIATGRYRCRTIKLGSRTGTGLAFVAYPPFECRIATERTMLSFAKLTGSQRPVGVMLPGNERRLIFLGTMMLGDETRAIVYGRDSERDVAGAVERIGPRRWRMIVPYPRFESTVDVIELEPAP